MSGQDELEKEERRRLFYFAKSKAPISGVFGLDRKQEAKVGL